MPATDVQEQVRQAAGSLLAFENVDFGQTIYLSKFYEAIEAIDGVAFVNYHRIQARGSGIAERSLWARARSSCSAHEIPIIPADNPAYAGGIRLRQLVEGGE